MANSEQWNCGCYTRRGSLALRAGLLDGIGHVVLELSLKEQFRGRPGPYRLDHNSIGQLQLRLWSWTDGKWGDAEHVSVGYAYVYLVKLQIEEIRPSGGPSALGREVDTGDGRFAFAGEGLFAQSLLESLLKVARTGVNAFECGFYYFETRTNPDGLAFYHNFFVVDGVKILTGTFTLYEFHVGKPAPPVLRVDDYSFAQDEEDALALNRYLYRRFYRSTLPGQLAALKGHSLFHYEVDAVPEALREIRLLVAKLATRTENTLYLLLILLFAMLWRILR